MNIEIPYELIKNFEEVEFIAFILDKNNSSIHRVDIHRNVDKHFFLKEKTYIEITDQQYDDCDTIVIYPFYQNRTWGEKIFKRKDSTRFVVNNTGEYLVKNKKNTGDIDSVKRWLSSGTAIHKNDNLMGNKNLIYFTFFGDKIYAELLRLLLSTLKKQSYQNFDLLFITDKETHAEIKKIDELKHFNVDYLIRPIINDPVDASMQKLKIYEYKKIDEYGQILFLDLDILVVGNVSKIFEERTRPNIFYSGANSVEQQIHATVYHRLIPYSEKELENFRRKAIFPFNAGQFFFKNTSTMRRHFDNINNFISTWDGEYFFEQSFLNCYFNVLEMSNIFKFKEQFGFVSINQNELYNKFDEETVFVHFMGSAADGKDKLSFIKTYYSHLL
jgi:hypothetical protein